MTSLHSRIRRALLSDPDEAVGSRLSGDTITAAVERIVAECGLCNGPAGMLPLEVHLKTMPHERLREAWRNYYATLAACWMPCACLKSPQSSTCASQADEQLRALKSDGGSPSQPDPRDALIARMREALRPFAAVQLWRDRAPAFVDEVVTPLSITADDVRRARAVLAEANKDAQ